MELKNITIEHFSTLLHTEVNIQFTDKITLAAEVLEVKALNSYSPLARTPFSILFKTQQKNEYYDQGTYIVHHPELKEILMFLSPKSANEHGATYEAIFS